MSEVPKVVVLCGSSRFVEIMAVCAWLIEKHENAITTGLHLLPSWYATKDEIPDHLAEVEGVNEQMDELHLRKIDLGHELFVVNFDYYVGTSTRREVDYGIKEMKRIRWFTNDPIGAKVLEILDKASTSRSKE